MYLYPLPVPHPCPVSLLLTSYVNMVYFNGIGSLYVMNQYGYMTINSSL